MCVSKFPSLRRCYQKSVAQGHKRTKENVAYNSEFCRPLWVLVKACALILLVKAVSQIKMV